MVQTSPLWRFVVGARDALDRRTGATYDAREFWEGHADAYVRERTSVAPSHERAQIQALTEAVMAFAPVSVLEVGCAYGRLMRLLAEQDDVVRIVGCDLSPKMLAHARDYLGSLPLELVHADAGNLPFGDRSFDVVYTYGLLMHVPARHIATVVGEITRVAIRGVACLETAPPVGKPFGSRRSYAFSRAVFAHDYATLFAEAGWRTTRARSIGSRLFFVCRPMDPPAP